MASHNCASSEIFTRLLFLIFACDASLSDFPFYRVVQHTELESNCAFRNARMPVRQENPHCYEVGVANWSQIGL
jgi:hypothetical protein